MDQQSTVAAIGNFSIEYLSNAREKLVQRMQDYPMSICYFPFQYDVLKSKIQSAVIIIIAIFKYMLNCSAYTTYALLLANMISFIVARFYYAQLANEANC